MCSTLTHIISTFNNCTVQKCMATVVTMAHQLTLNEKEVLMFYCKRGARGRGSRGVIQYCFNATSFKQNLPALDDITSALLPVSKRSFSYLELVWSLFSQTVPCWYYSLSTFGLQEPDTHCTGRTEINQFLTRFLPSSALQFTAQPLWVSESLTPTLIITSPASSCSSFLGVNLDAIEEISSSPQIVVKATLLSMGGVYSGSSNSQ